MRFQLLAAFTLIIAVVVGISWYLAVRTTKAQFSIFIAETSDRQAHILAPGLVAEYNRLGDWQTVQDELITRLNSESMFFPVEIPQSSIQINQVATISPYSYVAPEQQQTRRQTQSQIPFSFNFREAPRTSRVLEALQIWLPEWYLLRPQQNGQTPTQNEIIGDISFEVQPSPGMIVSLFFSNGNRQEQQLSPYLDNAHFTQSPSQVQNLNQNQNGTGGTFILEPSNISLVAGNIMLANQRAIVLDKNNVVMLDSQQELNGKQITSFEHGVPLVDSFNNSLGTLIITSTNGVFSIEQSSFLEEVQRGFLYSGLISGGLALILAYAIAYRVVKPIRLLMAATDRIQNGEWGYQVDSRAGNEIGQLAEAFNQMSHHLAEQRSLRGRLVDDLAHELNTPLSLMRLELQGMKDGFQTPGEAALHIEQELTEVSELVSDLIFLASRDTSPEPQMDWLELNVLVENAMRRFESTAEDKNLNLNFHPAKNLPLIFGDACMVQRAISNLITNAIRYTLPGGSITLETSFQDKSVHLQIRDTGKGIPPEHIPHIFERFYRVDDSRNRKSGGRGLGLAIVRQIMEQHRGDIRVESQPGHGSTFILAWPGKSY